MIYKVHLLPVRTPPASYNISIQTDYLVLNLQLAHTGRSCASGPRSLVLWEVCSHRHTLRCFMRKILYLLPISFIELQSGAGCNKLVEEYERCCIF